jgi:hypothetical protein
MSDLTLCLITKGRAEYLGSLLASLDRCLKYDHIQVLVLLNGVEDEIAAQFNEWSHNYPAKVKLQRYQDNDARLSRFWPTILEIKTKWVSFPSDDDILNDSFLSKWNSFENSHSNFGAIATRLELIGPSGSRLGVVRNPSYNPKLSLPESAVRAFSECPFLWPGLIIQVASLPSQIPDSRYVLDWWVGLHLLFSNSVQVSEEVLVNYRVHDGQESAVASLSRKNLEAVTHLGNFVAGDLFADWITSRSQEEIVEFVGLFAKYRPLYGDIKFSSELVSIITRRVTSLRQENEVQVASLLMNALAHDVLVEESQLKYLGIQKHIPEKAPRANFNLEFCEGVCEELESILRLNNFLSADFPTVLVGCNHSTSETIFVKIDCKFTRPMETILDNLVVLGEEQLKSKQVFVASVSPFEYNLIRKYRIVKMKMPFWLNRVFYRRSRQR